MISLITVSKAQKKLAGNVRSQRLNLGFTQEGLAERSGVRLPTLRKFEQKGLISLESFLKLLMTLGVLEVMVNASEPQSASFESIDEVLEGKKAKIPIRGWRK